MEEPLFRGPVIGHFEPLAGKGLALISTSPGFALARLRVACTARVAGSVALVFVPGLLRGVLVQKSRSIRGSVPVHARGGVAGILLL